MSNVSRAGLWSARVSRAGLGLAPNQFFVEYDHIPLCEISRKVRDREDALANPQDARAPQK